MKFSWTDKADTELLKMAAQGLDNEAIGQHFGTSPAAVSSRKSRLGYQAVIKPRDRDRVIELVKAGWTHTRIARQMGIHAGIVDVCLSRQGALT